MDHNQAKTSNQMFPKNTQFPETSIESLLNESIEEFISSRGSNPKVLPIQDKINIFTSNNESEESENPPQEETPDKDLMNSQIEEFCKIQNIEQKLFTKVKQSLCSDEKSENPEIFTSYREKLYKLLKRKENLLLNLINSAIPKEETTNSPRSQEKKEQEEKKLFVNIFQQPPEQIQSRTLIRPAPAVVFLRKSHNEEFTAITVRVTLEFTSEQSDRKIEDSYFLEGVQSTTLDVNGRAVFDQLRIMESNSPALNDELRFCFIAEENPNPSSDTTVVKSEQVVNEVEDENVIRYSIHSNPFLLQSQRFKRRTFDGGLDPQTEEQSPKRQCLTDSNERSNTGNPYHLPFLTSSFMLPQQETIQITKYRSEDNIIQSNQTNSMVVEPPNTLTPPANLQTIHSSSALLSQTNPSYSTQSITSLGVQVIAPVASQLPIGSAPTPITSTTTTITPIQTSGVSSTAPTLMNLPNSSFLSPPTSNSPPPVGNTPQTNPLNSSEEGQSLSINDSHAKSSAYDSDHSDPATPPDSPDSSSQSNTPVSGVSDSPRDEPEQNTVDITPLLSLPQKEAARSLGISESMLCKRFKESAQRKWPFRSLRKIDKMISSYCVQQADGGKQIRSGLSREDRDKLEKLIQERKECLEPVKIRISSNDKIHTAIRSKKSEDQISDQSNESPRTSVKVESPEHLDLQLPADFPIAQMYYQQYQQESSQSGSTTVSVSSQPLQPAPSQHAQPTPSQQPQATIQTQQIVSQPMSTQDTQTQGQPLQTFIQISQPQNQHPTMAISQYSRVPEGTPQHIYSSDQSVTGQFLAHPDSSAPTATFSSQSSSDVSQPHQLPVLAPNVQSQFQTHSIDLPVQQQTVSYQTEGASTQFRFHSSDHINNYQPTEPSFMNQTAPQVQFSPEQFRTTSSEQVTNDSQYMATSAHPEGGLHHSLSTSSLLCTEIFGTQFPQNSQQFQPLPTSYYPFTHSQYQLNQLTPQFSATHPVSLSTTTPFSHATLAQTILSSSPNLMQTQHHLAQNSLPQSHFSQVSVVSQTMPSIGQTQMSFLTQPQLSQPSISQLAPNLSPSTQFLQVSQSSVPINHISQMVQTSLPHQTQISGSSSLGQHPQTSLAPLSQTSVPQISPASIVQLSASSLPQLTQTASNLISQNLSNQVDLPQQILPNYTEQQPQHQPQQSHQPLQQQTLQQSAHVQQVIPNTYYPQQLYQNQQQYQHTSTSSQHSPQQKLSPTHQSSPQHNNSPQPPQNLSIQHHSFSNTNQTFQIADSSSQNQTLQDQSAVQSVSNFQQYQIPQNQPQQVLIQQVAPYQYVNPQMTSVQNTALQMISNYLPSTSEGTDLQQITSSLPSSESSSDLTKINNSFTDESQTFTSSSSDIRYNSSLASNQFHSQNQPSLSSLTQSYGTSPSISLSTSSSAINTSSELSSDIYSLNNQNGTVSLMNSDFSNSTHSDLPSFPSNSISNPQTCQTGVIYSNYSAPNLSEHQVPQLSQTFSSTSSDVITQYQYMNSNPHKLTGYSYEVATNNSFNSSMSTPSMIQSSSSSFTQNGHEGES